jgi:hypothetical protein
LAKDHLAQARVAAKISRHCNGGYQLQKHLRIVWLVQREVSSG